MTEVEALPIQNIPMPMDSAEGFQEFVAVGGTVISPTEGDVNLSTTSDNDIKPVETEGWYKRYCRWTPTSKGELDESERKILSYIKTAYKGRFVDIGSVDLPSKCKWSWRNKSEERKIWTLTFNEQASDKTPLVIIHGLCAAAGLWALNMDALAENRTVYAMDLLGFGKSSRPQFSYDASDAETQHVEAIEAWRKEMKLERFVLLGHSMGGFLSSAYTLKYPDSVAHLVLADPWGFPKKPDDITTVLPLHRSRTVKIVASIGQKVNPLAIVRAAGPYGPGLIPKVRPDLVQKFEALNQNGSASVGEYIYHCNAQHPTGEEAFRTMMDYFGWAKNPMYNRIHDLKPELPLTMIYGGKTWLPQIPEDELTVLRPNSSNKVHTIPDAGHHVYADDQPMFNEIVNEVGFAADQR